MAPKMVSMMFRSLYTKRMANTLRIAVASNAHRTTDGDGELYCEAPHKGSSQVSLYVR